MLLVVKTIYFVFEFQIFILLCIFLELFLLISTNFKMMFIELCWIQHNLFCFLFWWYMHVTFQMCSGKGVFPNVILRQIS